MEIHSRRVWLVLLMALTLLGSGCLGSSSTTLTYSIQGSVKDADGNGLMNQNVVIVNQGKTETVITDAQGKFDIHKLKGITEVIGPQIADMCTLPTEREVKGTNNQVDFVLHPIRGYGEDVDLPFSKIVVYEDVIFDFSNTTLNAHDTIVVDVSEIGPRAGMLTTGPVVNIEVSSPFSEPAVVAFETTDPNSTLFRYNDAEDAWYPVLGATFVEGTIQAELLGFSTYGVFTAPQAPAPTANPTQGTYQLGTTIQLVGEGSIYYTTDVNNPTGESLIYDDGHKIVLAQANLVIKAVNVLANHVPSEMKEFRYEISSDPLVPILGPKFVTLSGVNTYFDFDQEQITTDNSKADMRLWAQQYGSEFIMIRLENFSGTWFRPDPSDVEADQECAYEYFRTVTETDWIESDLSGMGNLGKNDTILLKTSGGKFVKLFVIDIRGHWNHEDRPAVDFAYIFTDEVDLGPPVIEQVTLVLKDGTEISKPITDTIEFRITAEADYLSFHLNEIAYSNRALFSVPDDLPFRSPLWWYPPYYYLRPSQSDQFLVSIHMDGYNPPITTLRILPADDQFYLEYTGSLGSWTDKGYYFSDLLGNQLTELPFSEIVIIKE